jgi:hypothetical protein
MVGVAQWVECQSVELVVAGSKPVTHPTFQNLQAERSLFGFKDDAFVAQLDRVTDFESVGRRFDSCRTHSCFCTGR